MAITELWVEYEYNLPGVVQILQESLAIPVTLRWYVDDTTPTALHTMIVRLPLEDPSTTDASLQAIIDDTTPRLVVLENARESVAAGLGITEGVRTQVGNDLWLTYTMTLSPSAMLLSIGCAWYLDDSTDTLWHSDGLSFHLGDPVVTVEFVVQAVLDLVTLRNAAIARQIAIDAATRIRPEHPRAGRRRSVGRRLHG